MANVLFSSVTAQGAQAVSLADGFLIDQIISAAHKTRYATLGTLQGFLNKVTVTTMSGNATITSSSNLVHHQDPNGSNRDTTLDATLHAVGRQVTVVHTGSANTITVKDSGGGTIATLSKGQTGIFTRDTSAWLARTTTSASGAVIDTPTFSGTATGPLVVSGDITAQTGSDFVKLFGAQGKIQLFYSGVESVILQATANTLSIDKGIVCSVNSNAFLRMQPVTPASQTAYISLYRAGYVDWSFVHGTDSSLRIMEDANERARCVGGRWLFGTGTDDGVSAVQMVKVDAGTATIVTGAKVLHESSGTPGAGFGVGQIFNLESSTTSDQNAGAITYEWVVATHASRTARGKIVVYDTAAREALRVEASGSAAMIGFLGANAVAQQVSGSNLTNNVTSGGTDDTITNWTDLTTYATDAAAIRNAVYQLARKLKQVNDSLRTYGLLT